MRFIGAKLLARLAKRLGSLPRGWRPNDDWSTYECGREVCEKIGFKFIGIPFHFISEDGLEWHRWVCENSLALKRAVSHYKNPTKKKRSSISSEIGKIKSPSTLSRKAKKAFFVSNAWRSLRYKVIKKYGAKCMACGRSHKLHNVVIHVDHIRPIWTHPELRLDETNLQVLCEDCNVGKGCLDSTDFRPDHP